MNILIKLMSIVSLVIAPSLSQMTFQNATPSFGQNPALQQPATPQGTFQTRVITGPAGNPDQMAYDEYRTLMAKLEEDGLFKIEENSIMVKDGQIFIDNKPVAPEVAAKYDYLVKEITRVQLQSDQYQKLDKK